VGVSALLAAMTSWSQLSERNWRRQGPPGNLASTTEQIPALGGRKPSAADAKWRLRRIFTRPGPEAELRL